MSGYDLEVWQGGLGVATAWDYDFSEAFAMIMDYAREFAKEGEIKITGIPADQPQALKETPALEEWSRQRVAKNGRPCLYLVS